MNEIHATAFGELNRQLQMLQDALGIRERAITVALNPIVFIDFNGRITDLNPAAVKAWGYSAAGEVLGRSTLEFSADPEEVKAVLREVRRTGSWIGEVRALRKDGSVRQMQLAASIVVLNDGTPAGMMGSFVDITERLAAEQERNLLLEARTRELRYAENLFESAFETASIGMALVSLDGTFLRVNRSLCRTLGYSPEGLVGVHFRAVSHPEDLEAQKEIIDAFLRGNTESLVSERRYIHKLGHAVWVRVSVTPLRDESGSRRLFVTQVEDVNERVLAENALGQSERRFRTLVTRSPMGVLQFDATGRCVFVNGSWERLAGVPAWNARGEGWLESVHPEDRGRVRAWWRDVRDVGWEFACEYRLLSPNGMVSWVLGSAVAIRDEQGRAVGYLESLADLTERKSFELELIRAREEADRASAAKSEFLSRMSHELRTPLNAILGFSQLLQADGDTYSAGDPMQKERVDLIFKAGLHLLDLINEVLDLARIEEGKLALDRRPVDLRTVIDDCLRLIQPMADERKVRVRDLTEGSRCPRAEGDALRIRQVLLNLLSNAVKYNRPSGAVTLIVDAAESGSGQEKIRISVQDTGYGIPAAQLDGLFKPFSRLDVNRSQAEGTGVGLALSKRLVEAMGGAVGASSDFGDGSTFWFELTRSS